VSPDDCCELLPLLADFYNDEEAARWMHSEQKLLGGRRPADCSREEVERLIDQLQSGAYI
jgi:uncharacterized protein (DUF2384 family)